MQRRLGFVSIDSKHDRSALGVCTRPTSVGSTGWNLRDSRGAVVVVQHATQTLPPLDHTCFSKRAWLWADYPVGQALVVALSMVMQNELSNPCAQRALTEQDHPLQAGFLDAAYESLGRRVGVRSQLHPMST